LRAAFDRRPPFLWLDVLLRRHGGATAAIGLALVSFLLIALLFAAPGCGTVPEQRLVASGNPLDDPVLIRGRSMSRQKPSG